MCRELDQLQQAWESFSAGILNFLPRLLSAAVILLLGLAAVHLLPRPVQAMMKRTSLDPVATKYALRVVRIAIWSLVAIMVLDKLGVPVGSLLAVLAAVGAAVALAIRENLANLASGMVLLFSKPFKAGDFIEVDGAAGTITEIELMFTYLDMAGNMRAAIPNTKMMTATIVNYSAHENRRQDFDVAVEYGCDLDRAREILRGLADAHPLVLREPEPPRAEVRDYGDSAVTLMLRVWCRSADYWELRFDMNARLLPALKAAGIEIPFPQMDVHIHPADREEEKAAEQADWPPV
ncbi:MAG: mechanosensitive ion channel family protein [Clostridiales bacterium]|nr:mechanosensitive ion channel family protein [Clostridiales bacterium]